MRSVQLNLLWPLRLILVLSVAVPVLLLGYAAWSTHRTIERHTDERIERALDILQEHTLKALQTVERTLAETNEVLRGLDDDAIRADEERLSARLHMIQESLPQIQSIWAFDVNASPLVASTLPHVPRDLNNNDRDYFRAQLQPGSGTFIGDVVQSKLGNLRFFVVSARRPVRPDGGFNGIVAVSLLPEHFRSFYERLSQGVADQFGLVRTDGAILARFPDAANWPERLDPQRSPFMQEVARNPRGSLLTATSSVDQVERRSGYRKLPNYPIFVVASIATSTMRDELWRSLRAQLAFGAPATLAMVALSLYALRRSERVQAEVARREIAEAALKQAQRLEAVGQLTGGVAHDFNNLLMVVSGNLERLRRYPTADERQRRALDAIEEAARRGTSLTRQLLSFSRRQTHEAVPIALAERMPQLQDMLRSSLRGDIEIELQIDGALWQTKIDLSEFDLAMLNLAVNARDAMQAGGRLTLSARNVRFDGEDGLRGDFVAIAATDTGGGMTEDVAAHAFDPFFTTKDVGKGTGLGLSQVYGFAQQSGGTATIASRPGAGTTVTLFLPRTHEPSAKVAAPAGMQPTAESVRHGHVLLVEDNQDVAQINLDRLRDLGFRVTLAYDADSALRLLRAGTTTPVDILFSDIVMPGQLNGVDLARAVRREFGDRIAIVLATGYSDVAQAAADEGFPILRKPFDEQQMRDVLLRAQDRPGPT